MTKTNPPDNFIVLTGGPGTGKTTLLVALADRGYPVMPEAGRAIIQDQHLIGGPIGVRQDTAAAVLAYANAQLIWDLRSYRAAQALTGPVFFDRGVIDLAGYLPLMGQPVPPHIANAVEQFPYHRRVFVAPPWRAIYAHDAERKHDFATAEHTHRHIAAAYDAAGYELVELPRDTVDARLAFVRTTLGLP